MRIWLKSGDRGDKGYRRQETKETGKGKRGLLINSGL
jgi:hypothetical protein